MDRVKSWLPLITLLVVVHSAAGFDACMDYILTTPNFDSTAKIFQNKYSSNYYIRASGGHDSDLPPAVSCSSTYMNQFTWDMMVNGYTPCSSQSSSQWGFGLWVKFLSTIGNDIIVIGWPTKSVGTYKISSSTEGTLSFTYDNNGATSASETLIDVPNNSWTFLTLYWVDNTFKVYLPGKAEVSKASTDSNNLFNAPYQYGYITFGSSVQAYFYELVGFQAASISGAAITLSIGSETYTTGTCPAGCSDTYCISGSTCISSYGLCSKCDSTGCLACGNTIRDPATYCTNCIGGFCCSDNCSKCSSATVCTVCNTGYFLYDKDASTTCASCKDSCSACEESPSCFECSDLVVKDGDTCRVDSVGYQLSFSYPNIVLDFAHPLGVSFSINNLAAKASDNSPISTSAWALSGCSAGSTSCKIVTNNLSESMLPIALDFSFTQG